MGKTILSTFTIVGNACPLTRIATTIEVPLRKPTDLENETPKPVVTLVYLRKPRKSKTNVPVSKYKVVQIVLCYLDSGYSKHMTGDRSQLTNFIGNVTISRVCYVKGLGHNLFFVGQFCDSNLKVAFRQHTCFIHNLECVDLLIGSRGNNLYTLSLGDMMAYSPICLLSKASKTNKNKPHKPKSEDTNQEKLYLLHMDLYGPMRVASVNGKKYIHFIVDDYSQFTWLKCLRTDNGTEFVNQTLREYYVKVGISHETFVSRSPQQNGVIETRNRMLIEASRTMLIYAKALLFLWAKAVATACYTQNRSIVHLRHGKKPYKLLHDKLPDLSFFHVFGAFCYPTNDSENLGKLQPKADIVARVSATSTGSPSSTTINQDAPSPSNSQTTPKTQSPVIPNDVEEDNHDLNFVHMNNDPFFGIPIPENDSETSSSSDVIPTVVQTAAPNSKHSKYALESLRKYGMESSDPMDTPMLEKSKLDEDTQGKAVDPTHCRGMIGTLMYLTASRPDLIFAVCMCARYHAKC
ncbi:retrovirus-related pol polyprotein from transposon TNT 1-94 [Tanacetum coccineum]|uniref:Retrovirus-related pol polyprotein from transposon TNT 1-94 n=1 Tax=Tanacetum coccineum TaxID=301880 RepID=A0ABQ5CIL7_9ASTR